MKAPVITGSSAVTALGRTLAETRAALAAGRSAVAPVEEDGAPKAADRSPAARIGPFTTEPELAKSKARRLDRGSQYAVVAVRQVLADAGYALLGREERTGILLGTGSAGAGPLTEFERQMAVESPDAASPFLFPNTVANAPASQAAIEVGIKGPNVTIIQKDPAALNALFYARMLLADGRADALLVGAADEWNLVYHRGYESVRATRTSTRPGFVLGEGAAVVLVESEESARARGGRIDARVAGLSSRGAAVSPHLRRADPSVLAAAIREALAEARLTPGQIGLVHLSRNGSPFTDAAEDAALREVFGANVPRTAAVKDSLGENPAIGAIQLALAAAELRENPGIGAILLDAFGAGGNVLAAVLTAP
ncbi:MAG: beta-ketoacyl synthase N-terminal-like domain-containing protein [Acidobacteriota bacterium]|nr:beta-ketoacyl synthase N-terminal-like domain-containing protein [Acidobacteriota bacterium]